MSTKDNTNINHKRGKLIVSGGMSGNMKKNIYNYITKT